MGLNITAEISKEKQTSGEDWDALLWHQGRLFSAGYSSGKVKVWSRDLKFLGELSAHEYPIYTLASGPSGTFFTSSSDCTIKQWRLREGTEEFELLSTLTGHEEPARKMRFHDGYGRLYSGDDLGNVMIWQEGKLLATLNTVEEIWDMVTKDDLLVTCRHSDVVINTVTQKEDKFRDAVKNTLPGKGPLLFAGDKLVFGDRIQNDILVNEGFKTGNPNLGRLKGHDALVNAVQLLGERTLVSGGGDGKVYIWDLDSFFPKGEIRLGGYINDLAVDVETGTIFAGGQNKILVAIRQS